MVSLRIRPIAKLAALVAGAGLGVGCGAPNKANIELRKQVQSLQSQNAQLRRQHEADQQVIQGLRDRVGVLPTLPATRLAELFTTHGLQLGRLTGGARLDRSTPGDQGVVVYVVPIDESGEKLKAAGTFDVQAFDLADTQHPLVGQWHFDLQQSRAAWNGWLLDYTYVLTCPWQTPPTHPDLTLKVTFFDELTQTPFTAQRVVRVNLPAAPTTAPKG